MKVQLETSQLSNNRRYVAVWNEILHDIHGMVDRSSTISTVVCWWVLMKTASTRTVEMESLSVLNFDIRRYLSLSIDRGAIQNHTVRSSSSHCTYWWIVLEILYDIHGVVDCSSVIFTVACCWGLMKTKYQHTGQSGISGERSIISFSIYELWGFFLFLTTLFVNVYHYRWVAE